MGSRDLLLQYLWQRMVKAWDAEEINEAQSFNRYFDAIDEMGVIEYNEMYTNPNNKKVTAHDSI